MNEALIKKLIAERGEKENGPIRLSFSADLKADIEENTLKVVASTMGTADDRSGDVIFPGAYAKAIPGFLKNGFVAIGHEWDELPVAMPTTAEEKGRQMVCEAVFHQTQKAQDARTVCMERLKAGKSVSVSVGFMPDYSEDGIKWFDTGADLLAWAIGKGYDMAGFDQPAIKKLKYCRAILKISEWFEWSIVGVGMNRGAKAIAAKSLTEPGPDDPETKTISDEDKPPAGPTLAEHLDSVLAAVEEVTTRVADYKAMRERDARPMSPERVEQLKKLNEALKALLPEDAPPPDPEPVVDPEREARLKAMLSRAGTLTGASKK